MSNTNEARFKIGDITVIRFVVRRMLSTVAVDTRLREVTKSPPTEGIDTVLDFSRVEFISSAVLNRLIVLDRAISSMGGKLVLCGLSSSLRDLFSMTRLDQVFRIVDDQDEALRQFGLPA